MKAKTTIDERILTLKYQIANIEGTIRKHQEVVNNGARRLIKKKDQITKLEAKKARQQKDQAIGDKLVESGVITEKEHQDIQKLPNPQIYNPEV